ncbi:DUF3244 domain-containing protein [Cecembia lonarensis]|uniref:MG2 domain protein n=1 Tax=Cecembia lonarensis (strain CCUG 58316 / KCTC 22772 / LW9) TaxID=1225176 RepID=K1LAM3_CECL9|nr:DUF3244 domain-containing protein [Cecembia lonarensis]EKB47458.1 hypothetical protein B879_03946 [Cecembia lonarensis LW9]
MKKMLTLALIATLGLGGYANAENVNLEVMTEVKNSNNKVKVILKEGLGKVKLEVLDQNGKKLHQQTVFVKQDLMVPYDLSELPIGKYQLKIESGSKSSSGEAATYAIERKITKSELPLMAYRKDLEDNSIKLTVIGLEDLGVKVKIMGKSGKELFEEKIDQPNAFTKIYHFNNINKKEVSIQVTDAMGRQKVL